MIRLNSQAQRYGGFTHGNRDSGRTQKIPIGTVDIPHFKIPCISMIPMPYKQNALVKLREIREASLQREPQEKFNLSLDASFRGLKAEQLFFFLKTVCFYQNNDKNITDAYRNGQGLL